MKYCPQCGDEFFDDVSRCESCNTDLVDETSWQKIVEERKQEAREVFVKVKTIDNQFEADVLKDAMEKEGIPVLVRSFQDTMFNGIYIPQKGWGIIEVPDDFRERAKKIIDDFSKSQE